MRFICLDYSPEQLYLKQLGLAYLFYPVFKVFYQVTQLKDYLDDFFQLPGRPLGLFQAVDTRLYGFFVCRHGLTLSCCPDLVNLPLLTTAYHCLQVSPGTGRLRFMINLKDSQANARRQAADTIGLSSKLGTDPHVIMAQAVQAAISSHEKGILNEVVSALCALAEDIDSEDDPDDDSIVFDGVAAILYAAMCIEELIPVDSRTD